MSSVLCLIVHCVFAVYADPDNITPEMVQQRTEITRREGARFAPSSFISGLLDPVRTREDFLGLFRAAGERGVPVGVLASSKSPKRSKREMESLDGAQGVALYQVVPGALLPWEEYPSESCRGPREIPPDQRAQLRGVYCLKRVSCVFVGYILVLQLQC